MSTSQPPLPLPPVEMQKKQPASTRLSQACIQCRERKRKCNGESPCLPCTKESGKCTYSESRKRGPPRGYLESLESRLGDTENALLECLLLLEGKGWLPPPGTLIPRRLAIEQQNTAQQRIKRVSTWEDLPLVDWSTVWGWKRAVSESGGSVREEHGPEESFGVSVVAKQGTTDSLTSTQTHRDGQVEMDRSEQEERLPVHISGTIREGGGGFWGLDTQLGGGLTEVIQNRHHEAHSPSQAIVVANSYGSNSLLRLPPGPLESDRYRFEDATPHSGQAAVTSGWGDNMEERGGQIFAEPNASDSLVIMEEQASTQSNETSDTLVDRQLFW